MEYFKSFTYQDLKDIRDELEKSIEFEGRIKFEKIELKSIYYDKDKDLVTTYFFRQTKLKDLIDKYTGEKMFKDEFQTNKYRFCSKNLEYIKVSVDRLMQLQNRHQIIITEMLNRKEGTINGKIDATNDERFVWYNNMHLSISILASIIMNEAFETHKDIISDKQLHKIKCYDYTKSELKKLLTKDRVPDETKITYKEWGNLIKTLNQVYEQEIKNYLERYNLDIQRVTVSKKNLAELNEYDLINYWLNNYVPRTPEEIVELENEIKSNLLKEAETYLQKNPNAEKTAQQLADEQWEEHFDNSEYLREYRKRKRKERGIDLLFDTTFYELLKDSDLLIKSSEEKEMIKEKCYKEFNKRIEDYIGNDLDGMPSPNIPIDNPKKMKIFVKNILLDIEPKLANKNINIESLTEINIPDRDYIFDDFLNKLPEFIKGRIRKRINTNIKAKRSFYTLEDKEQFINKHSENILTGIKREIAHKLIQDERKDKIFEYPTERELAQLIDEFLLAIDENKYPIPNYEDEMKNIPVKKGIKSRAQIKIDVPTKRLNLTPSQREILNSTIVNEVKDFIYAGKGSQEQAFEELSKKSKKIFKYVLTPKAIEGRYNRNKNKHF